MLNVSFKFMYLLMRLLMVRPGQQLIPEESKLKIWMHINHCLSSAKAISVLNLYKIALSAAAYLGKVVF